MASLKEFCLRLIAVESRIHHRNDSLDLCIAW